MRIGSAGVVSVLFAAVWMTAGAQPAPEVDGTRVGDVFLEYAEFKADTLEGGEISAKDFKGKYVFVDFWASWCGPCESEFPFIARVEKLYSGEKFMMFGISLDTDLKAIDPFKKKYGVTYSNIADGKGWKSPWVAKYGIRSIPTNFLLDPEGKILLRDLRSYGLEAEVARALGQESPYTYIFDAEALLEKLDDEARFSKATEKIKKALELAPKVPEAHEKMGDIQLDQDQDAKAREWYEKGVGLLENSLDEFLVFRLHEKIAETYVGEENWNAVVKEYDKMAAGVEGFMKIRVKAGLIMVLDQNGQKELGLAHRKTLLGMFEEQPKEMQERNALYIENLKKQIKALEDQGGEDT